MARGHYATVAPCGFSREMSVRVNFRTQPSCVIRNLLRRSSAPTARVDDGRATTEHRGECLQVRVVLIEARAYRRGCIGVVRGRALARRRKREVRVLLALVRLGRRDARIELALRDA